MKGEKTVLLHKKTAGMRASIPLISVFKVKHIFSFFLLTFVSLSLLAVPVQRVRRTVTLDDGRTTVTTYGDEAFDYLLSADGTIVLQTDSTFHDTGLTLDEYLATLNIAPRKALGRIGSAETALIKPAGTKHIPVLLLSFPNQAFSVASTEKKVNDFYDSFFNADNTSSTTSNYGSVRQYFSDQSLGLFTPEFTIIGPIEMDKNYGYYGEDGSSGNKDLRFGEMVREAFRKATATHKDWTQFDNDGNGEVDLCILLCAGFGQNYTNSIGITETIWPKEMPIRYVTDEVTMSGCCSACELRPTAASGSTITASQPDGVGVVIHEISHALGLPDLYDTRNVAFGLDSWSVMDYGMYTGSSRWPVGYTAYEREFLGWQQTETITGPTTLKLRSFGKGGKGYKLINDANPAEYYILDNRQADGWDTNLCNNRGHGMLVLHVDYAPDRWSANNVNTDPNHQRVTIIPANNTLIGSNTPGVTSSLWRTSLQGNPYPGITGNHALTDTSLPEATVFTGGHMGKPLINIQEHADGTVSVKVMPLGTLDVPTDLHFEDIGYTSARLHWKTATDAEAYTLRILKEGLEVQTIDSIRGDSYTLQNLEAASEYSCQLRAISNKHLDSDWAESEAFRATPDGITEITMSTQTVRVYDLHGQFVSECFADELSRLSVNRGIYVVRHKDGKTRKIRIGR